MSSTEFYQRREIAERQMAARAVDPFIAAIHESLAEEYSRRVERSPNPTIDIEI